jgi:hypothetical protein
MRNATAQDLIRTASRAAGQLLAALAMLAFIAVRALAQLVVHHEPELSTGSSTAASLRESAREAGLVQHVAGRRTFGRSYDLDDIASHYADEEPF